MSSFAIILAPNYEAIIDPAYLLPFVAELSIALWLLIKGVNVEQWEIRALESA
jgi:hypothetical protein